MDFTPMVTMTPRFRRIGLAAAFGALALGWLVALQDPLHPVETDLTSWINEAPQWLADLLWPVMQLGSLGGLVLVAVVVFVWRRSLAMTLVVLASGTLAWFAAKAIKATVERGRPLEYLADITVREGSGTGFGFVSGHTSVAFAWATAVAPDLTMRGRLFVFSLAGLVGLTRIVYGVHLPADVVGGAGVGIACAIAVRSAVARWLGSWQAVAATDDVGGAASSAIWGAGQMGGDEAQDE